MAVSENSAKPNRWGLSASQLLDGFDLVVWIVVVLLALGGLLTALVMRWAGALTKCYAVSISIVLCTHVSVCWGVQKVTLHVRSGQRQS